MARVLAAALAALMALAGVSPAWAIGLPLTSLTNHASPSSTDLLPIEVAGTTTLLNISMAQLATYFAANSVSAGGSSGQIQYNNAGYLGGFTMSGDCTISQPSITCLKTGGVSFANSATTDTTNAVNISSGTLPSGRLAGSYTGITGVGTLTAGSIPTSLITGLSSYSTIHGTPTAGDCVSWYSAGAVQDSGAACGAGAGTVTTTGSPASGKLAVFSGSTAITNGDLTGDCTTSGTVATTCALAASKITSGTLATARLGSGTASSSTYLRGDQTWATVSGGVSASGTPTTGNCASWASSSSVQDAGAPCGSGAMVLLATITTMAGDTSETFSSISQAYSGLELDFWAADSANGVPNLTMTFNGVTSSCYVYQTTEVYNVSTVTGNASNGATGIVLGQITGQALTTGIAAQSQYAIKILNYAASGTNYNKLATWTGMSAGNSYLNSYTGAGAGVCTTLNGAGITSIKIATAGSGFVANGIFKLYGLN